MKKDMSKYANRNRTLDFLKGICILLVILTHYGWNKENEIRFLFPYWLDMAVPIFMIISGYVYAKSFERNNVNLLIEGYNIRLLRSVIRYTVPYGMMLCIEIILLIRNNQSFDILKLFLSGGIGPGSYYYPVMIQFVFIFPIIYMLIKKFDFIGFFICICTNIIYEFLQSAYDMNEECYRLLVFRYILVISFGCWLSIKKYETKMIWKILSFIIGLFFISMYSFGNYMPYSIAKWTTTSWCACLYIIPIFSWAVKKNMRCGIIEKIGKASYNIFLVQMIWFWKLNAIMYAIKSNFLHILLNMVICSVVGLAFYYIETPITNKIISFAMMNFNRIPKDEILYKLKKMLIAEKK